MAKMEDMAEVVILDVPDKIVDAIRQHVRLQCETFPFVLSEKEQEEIVSRICRTMYATLVSAYHQLENEILFDGEEDK